MLFSKYKIFHQMCSHDAGNVIQEPLNLKFLYKPPPPPPPDKTKTLHQ